MEKASIKVRQNVPRGLFRPSDDDFEITGTLNRSLGASGNRPAICPGPSSDYSIKRAGAEGLF